jgi:hypothetical protein
VLAQPNKERQQQDELEAEAARAFRFHLQGSDVATVWRHAVPFATPKHATLIPCQQNLGCRRVPVVVVGAVCRRDRVDGGAAGEESVGRGRSAVVLQRAEERIGARQIGGVVEAAGVIAGEVVAKRLDSVPEPKVRVAGVARWIRKDRALHGHQTLRGNLHGVFRAVVVGDRREAQFEIATTIEDGSRGAAGANLAKSSAPEATSATALIGEATAAAVEVVPGQGAVAYAQDARVHDAACPGAPEGTGGTVAREGAAKKRKRIKVPDAGLIPCHDRVGQGERSYDE